jgi:hypothetical protein
MVTVIDEMIQLKHNLLVTVTSGHSEAKRNTLFVLNKKGVLI